MSSTVQRQLFSHESTYDSLTLDYGQGISQAWILSSFVYTNTFRADSLHPATILSSQSCWKSSSYDIQLLVLCRGLSSSHTGYEDQRRCLKNTNLDQADYQHSQIRPDFAQDMTKFALRSQLGCLLAHPNILEIWGSIWDHLVWLGHLLCKSRFINNLDPHSIGSYS